MRRGIFVRVSAPLPPTRSITVGSKYLSKVKARLGTVASGMRITTESQVPTDPLPPTYLDEVGTLADSVVDLGKRSPIILHCCLILYILLSPAL